MGGTVKLCGLDLRHPVLNASGTFDPLAARRAFGDSVFEDFPFSAYVSKTVTVEPREGNGPPRLWELPSGLMNSIGLPNKGLERWLETDLVELSALPVPLIANVMGFERSEFELLVTGLDGRPEVAALELNVSCPNVETGTVIGSDPGECAALVGALRPLTSKPLIVKITPNASDPASVALAAQESGADGISLVNTLRGMALDPATRLPWLGGRTGGVSGPAIRAVALAQVDAVCSRVGIDVIAIGGIGSGLDAQSMLDLGATAVAIGTESFRDPTAGRRISAELDELCHGRCKPDAPQG